MKIKTKLYSKNTNAAIKNKSSSDKFGLVSYVVLSAIRVVLTCLPQLGYIHPDEYFQSLEIVAGHILDTDSIRTWDFNATFPIRCITFPYLTIGTPLKFLDFVSYYTSYYFGWNIKNSYTVLVMPRLFICTLSFIVDYCLYKICIIYGQNYRTRLCILASSFVMLVFGTHTFSNTLEMILLSVLIYCVAECMFYSDNIIFQKEFLTDKYNKASITVDKVKFHKLKAMLPDHTLRKCLPISTITVLGIFNRPTFICFAFFPVFFWLLRGLGTKTVTMYDFNIRMFSLILTGLPTLILLIVIDSFYYMYITTAEIERLDVSINSFVVTPLNFIRYNLQSSNLKDHGIHPMWLHIFVNVPLLFNVLGAYGLYVFGILAYRLFRGHYTKIPRIQSVVGLMTACFMGPVLLLSFIKHQEPRFLIPIILPLVFLHSQRLRTPSDAIPKNKIMEKSRSFLLKMWYICNILCLIFFGFLHQGGVYPLADYVSKSLALKPKHSTVHLVTSHIFMFPESLLLIPNSNRLRINYETGQKYRLTRQFRSYELGSKPLDDVYEQISAIYKVSQNKYEKTNHYYIIYLAIPASLSRNLNEVLVNKQNLSFVLNEMKTFYPHVSVEALPNFSIYENCMNNKYVDYCDTDLVRKSFFKYMADVVNQFGLVLYRVQKSIM